MRPALQSRTMAIRAKAGAFLALCAVLAATLVSSAAVSDGIFNPGLGGGGTSVVAPVLNDPTQAAANVAKIQAALNLGGRVQLSGNGAASINAPLIIHSNTALFLDQNLTISLVSGSNTNMLQNAAVASARTVTDANVSGTGFSSATANFTGADVGATLWVWSANTNSGILKTTIASVTNGTTVVLANAAVVALNPTQASIGPRDTNFSVSGGTWDRGSNGAGGANLSGINILFRRCDEFVFQSTQIIGGGGGTRYAVSIADATQFTVQRINFNYQSDGIHLLGPTMGGVIDDTRGFTLDDQVSLTPADWPGVNDIFGDITRISIHNIRPLTTNTAVKVLGGTNGSQILASKHIWIEDISGSTDNSGQGQGGIIWIGDDGGMPATIGGIVDDINIRNVAGIVPASGAGKNNQVFINASNGNGGSIRVSDITVDAGSNEQHAIYIGGGANIGILSLKGIALKSGATSSDILKIDQGSAVQTIVNYTFMDDCQIYPNAGSSFIELAGSNSLAFNIFMSNLLASNGTFAFINAPTAGQRTDSVSIINSSGTTTGFLALINNTSVFRLSNMSVPNMSGFTFNLGSSAAVTVYGTGTLDFNGKGIVTSGSPSFSVKGGGFPADISQVTSASQGDAAYNINASVAPYVVGPVTYDGTIWRANQGFSAKGTAVLVAGTKAVADTKITASSRINLFVQTPAGTQGAPFISALTAATGFTIKSTSATDTSTIAYEVEAY